jgi:hypothetical protein
VGYQSRTREIWYIGCKGLALSQHNEEESEEEMVKHNTLLMVLFGVVLPGALVFWVSTSPRASAASKSLSPQAVFASSGIIQRPSHLASTSTSVATSPTKVVRFSPSGIRGTIDTPADCWVSSLAAPRANAWRCLVVNTIYDPCFSASPQASYVICDANPAGDTRGLKAILAHPLPASTPRSGTQAWMMRLTDGPMCSFMTGASGIIGGERITYSCTDGALLVGSPHIGSVWMVKELKKGQSQLIIVSVGEAWT